MQQPVHPGIPTSTGARRALVVEDDRMIAAMLRVLLQRQGWQVEHAADGGAALDAIVTGVAPQLVLLDLILPVHDGLSLLQRLRAQAAWDRVPVVMLSGREDQEVVRRAMAAGANDYVTKPFDPQQLLDRVAALVPVVSLRP
ncbi:MAG: chemotaxis protein CheY [Ramlibacter sp.]|jgi:DNA-binding response OmpR family regulator|nr:chemotaxis protein CheY [Ramlibacter sp.]